MNSFDEFDQFDQLFETSERFGVLTNQLRATEDARNEAQKELAAWRAWANRIIKNKSLARTDPELRKIIEKLLIKSI